MALFSSFVLFSFSFSFSFSSLFSYTHAIFATCIHRSHYSWFRPTIQHKCSPCRTFNPIILCAELNGVAAYFFSTIVKNFSTFMAFYYVNFRRYVDMDFFLSYHINQKKNEKYQSKMQEWTIKRTDFFPALLL